VEKKTKPGEHTKLRNILDWIRISSYIQIILFKDAIYIYIYIYSVERVNKET
jgi:hypothetical protein